MHKEVWIAAYSYGMPTRRGADVSSPITLQPQRAVVTISPINGREMLTAEQVHDITGVPVSTLHDWAAKRECGIDAPGPRHIRLSNRHRRWTRRDVEQWIESARI